MKRRPNNLIDRVIELERLWRPKGGRFFMIWGIDESGLTDALNKAKAAGDARVGDKFNAAIWTSPTQPPAGRWVSLDEISHEELAILAGGKAKTQRSDVSSLDMARYSDAELSSFYANGLPSLVLAIRAV